MVKYSSYGYIFLIWLYISHMVICLSYGYIFLIWLYISHMVHLRFQLELTCDCDVRTFPFDQLPSHVRLLKGYAWKPVCIQVSVYLAFRFNIHIWVWFGYFIC